MYLKVGGQRRIVAWMERSPAQPTRARVAHRGPRLVVGRKLVARDFGRIELDARDAKLVATKRVDFDSRTGKGARQQRVKIRAGNAQTVDGHEHIARRQSCLLR